MRYIKASLLFLFLGVALTACVGVSRPLAQQDRQKIKTVQIETDVMSLPKFQFDDDLFYSHNVFKQPVMNFANKINIQQKLKTQMILAVNKSGYFKVASSHPDAILYVTIDQYGLMPIKGGFSMKDFTPFLCITGRMLYNNRLVWSGYANITWTNNQVKGMPIEKIMNSPKTFMNMWYTVSKVAAQQLIAQLSPAVRYQ